MSEITVEKTAEDSASKSLRVTVPVDRVREAAGDRHPASADADERELVNPRARRMALENLVRDARERPPHAGAVHHDRHGRASIGQCSSRVIGQSMAGTSLRPRRAALKSDAPSISYRYRS